MPSKLTHHIIGFDSKIFNLLEQMQPSIVKIYDYPSDTNVDQIRRRCPATLIVYRQYTERTWNDPADAFVAELSDALAKLSGRGIIWEGLNEPVLNSAADATALSNWFVRFAELMHARGEKVAAFSFSTGNPSLEYVPLLAPAATACDYLALHEYYNPTWGARDFTRYRQFRAELPPAARKPILITECGVDDGRNNGWQAYVSADQYLQILAEYDRALLQDPYLLGATIFQYGTGGVWQSFDVAGIGQALADYVTNAGGGWRGATQVVLGNVTFAPTTLTAGQLLNFSALVQNNTGQTISTQGPAPSFIYDEGSTFYTRGYPDVAGAYRIGIDFDGRVGIDHPYRWGLGAALAPGLSATITGAIRVKTPRTIRYWAGLVREQIAWAQDREGAQAITTQATPTNSPTITNVTLTPTTLATGELLNVSITVVNNSDQTLATQNPAPGFVYDEGDTFYTRGFADVKGVYRVGMDFDGRTGIDHPYRWGLGAALAPGQSATITGAIRLKTPRAINYWAGLVREQTAWVEDRIGAQAITVKSLTPNTLEITNVTFAPATLATGELLNVSVTVVNNTEQTLATQNPAPGFVYDEGDTFYTRGLPDVNGAYRVGIDFDGRAGIDHPYRWGLGAPLAPGASATITGAIRLKTPRAINYWAGLVREQIAWVQDRQGAQTITVSGVVPNAPQITRVTFTPTTPKTGQAVTVSITVQNNSNATLQTQGPNPGFAYDEGDTFYTRGLPDVNGAYRVGIDFDGRAGVDHPYRWGLGAPLAPGASTTITGVIKLKTPRAINYWAGLVREQIAWVQDRQGTQTITATGVPIPSHIFGIHDPGGEQRMVNAGKRGWVLTTVQVNGADHTGDFAGLTNVGLGVLVRLNHGYGSAGTLPVSTQYAAFAQQCAAFVAGSTGAHIWIIGNETNFPLERPGNNNGVGGEVITPALYAQCFALVRAAIKNVAGHADDWVVPAPPAPWNAQTTYAENPSGDWVQYWIDLLNACVQRNAPPDALALHTYTHGWTANLIADEATMDPPFQNRRYNFRAYRDFLGAVPTTLRGLPVLITEAQPISWQNQNTGWVQAAYQELNNWNAVAANQPIQALCLLRWQAIPGDPAGWCFSNKPEALADFDAALQNDYRVRM